VAEALTPDEPEGGDDLAGAVSDEPSVTPAADEPVAATADDEQDTGAALAVSDGAGTAVTVTADHLPVLEPGGAAIGPLAVASAGAAEAIRTRRRFSIAYGVLTAIAVVGVFGAVVAATGIGPDGIAQQWSDFTPQGAGFERATNIATYVAPRYRLDTGDQLVAVQATKSVVQSTVPIELVAVVKVDPSGAATQNYDVIQGGDSLVSYQLCGLGDACAIRTGTPSVDRERLLRREALELALYSFHDIPGVTTVVAYMPPAPGKKPTIALLFRKVDFKAQLDRPLAETVGPTNATPTTLAASPEKAVVESLTGTSRYGFGFSQLQDGNAALVLDPTKLQ
jgi:hypothetical protein